MLLLYVLQVSELTSNTNINPLLANALAAQSARRDTKSMVNSVGSYAGSREGLPNATELNSLVKSLAMKMGVSEYVAYKIIGNLMATGQATSFTEMQNFLREYLQGGAPIISQETLEQLRKPEIQSKSGKELDALFKPVIRDIKDRFVETRQQNVRNTAEVFSREDKFVSANPQASVTQLVNSPKEFASWLVNNKAAFIMLKANPELTYLLMTLANPNIQKSPVLLSEIAKMITQVIKMKRGKSQIEVVDDVVKETMDKLVTQEMAEHEASIVNTLKNVFDSVKSASVRDFMLEAERFAEEEIANLWSLTLKKEKQIEKQLQENITKFKRTKISRKKE
jgi:hypothetical protein